LRALLLVCFFASGASGLIFEVIWSRLLGHVFGATSLAVATTLSAFMGGLAIGALLIARQMHRVRRPALWYAIFEALIGLYGLAVPSLLGLADWVQANFWPGDGSSFLLYSAIRLAVAMVILLPPAALMGATLPLLSEAIARGGWAPGRTVGLLYSANTLGAVFGAGLVGFVLIPKLGVHQANLIAVGVDLLIAVVLAWAAFKLLPSETMKPRVEKPPQRAELSLGRSQILLAVVAMSGALSMAMQVLWTRGLSVVLGSSTYAFTIILVVFLGGLALGAAIAGRFVDADKRPLFRLGMILAFAGLLGFAGSSFIDELPHTLQGFVVHPDLTITELLSVELLLCGVVMFPACLLLGAVFPYVVRGLSQGGGLGDLVGRAYGANTIGAIVGSLGGAFVLIPMLTVYSGLVALHSAQILLGAGLIALAGSEGLERERRMRWVMGLIMVAATICLLPGWNISKWSLGMFRVSVARAYGAEAAEAFGRLIYHADGLATTVTVERSDGVTLLKVNGKVDASSHGDMPTQVLSGLLPVVLHKNPKDVAVIGWGSGVTPGAVLAAPIEHLDIIELEKEVVYAGRFFAEVNGEPEKDSRSRVIYDDGRNFMKATKKRYDIIISEPSNPWIAGASALFTREFFEILNSRLRPGGLSLQWIQLYELSGRSIKALWRSYAAVFPHALVVQAHPSSNDVFLIGSQEPIKLDRARLLALMKHAPAKARFAQARVLSDVDLLPRLVFGMKELKAWVGEGPLNTDDNALVEFEGPLDLLRFASRGADLPFFEAVEGRRHEVIARYTKGWGDGTSKAVAWGMARAGRFEDARRAMQAMSEPDPELAFILDRFKELDQRKVLELDVAERDADYRQVAEVMIDTGARHAENTLLGFDGFVSRSSAHAFLAGYVLLHAGEPNLAVQVLQRAAGDAAYREQRPALVYYLARALVEDGQVPEGLQVMQTLYQSKVEKSELD
jgi:spermidine synthase